MQRWFVVRRFKNSYLTKGFDNCWLILQLHWQGPHLAHLRSPQRGHCLGLVECHALDLNESDRIETWQLAAVTFRVAGLFKMLE